MNRSLLSVVLALSVLAGCKGGSPTSPTPSAEAPGTQTLNQTLAVTLPEGWSNNGLPAGEIQVEFLTAMPSQAQLLNLGQRFELKMRARTTLQVVLEFRKFNSRPEPYDATGVGQMQSSMVGEPVSHLNNFGMSPFSYSSLADVTIWSTVKATEDIPWLRAYAIVKLASGLYNSEARVAKAIDFQTDWRFRQ